MPTRLIFVSLVAAFLSLVGCNPKKDSNQPGGPTGGSGPSVEEPTTPHVFPTAGMSAAELDKARATTKHQLTEIALAFGYAEKKWRFYPAGIWGPEGRSVGLSWRVFLLPYIDPALYKEFNLKEAWDSPHNKALIAKMPQTYAAPGTEPSKGLTYYRSFTGPRTVMPPQPIFPSAVASGLPVDGARFNDIIGDGTANTGLVVEALKPVIWTKPEELHYADGNALPKLGGVFESGFHVIFCSGETRFVPKAKLDEKNLRRLILIDDRETLELP